jgi:HAD superfamily hydrolase (TIGR01509 family)
MRPRAVVFDFNGTLSNDEPILCGIFRELFAAQGKPLAAEEYYDRLAGLSDPEIVETWLGKGHSAIPEVIEQRIARYRIAVKDGSTVSEPVREAVRYAAERLPVAVVSGAARAEIEPVLEAAGLRDAISVIVSADDVVNGKPEPDGYLRALELLNEGLQPAEVVVFEDTEAGVAAAKTAGMRCIAVLGTLPAKRLGAADELVPGLERNIVERLLS